MNEAHARSLITDYCHRIHSRGWVANHDGNASMRMGEGRLLATPTAVSKAEIRPDMLLVLDAQGKVVQGDLRVFSEIGLHLAVYRARPDVMAVLHAHPPTATGFSASGVSLDQPLFPEVVVSLGAGIPTVPLAAPGKEAVRALDPFLDGYDAVLMESHGVLSWGDDLEQAYLRMELVEHVASMALAARSLGALRPLPGEMVSRLLAARARAGLGPEGRKARSEAPRPPFPQHRQSAERLVDRDLLYKVIEEELVKAFKAKS